jgi:hypothetical protein
MEAIPNLISKTHRQAHSLALLLYITGDICRSNQSTLLLGADVYKYTCLATAAICERCAADCEALLDRELEDVIEACLECAERCRRLGTDTGSAALSA